MTTVTATLTVGRHGNGAFTLYNCTFWEFVDGAKEKAKTVKYAEGLCPPRMVSE